MSLVPLDNEHGRRQAYVPSTSLSRKESRELQHQTDLVERQIELADYLQRREHSLKIKRMDEQARDRAFYVSNRMNESAAMAQRVINEPSEPIQARLASWHDIYQQVEQHIYTRDLT